jgi:2-polyprenyl-6-methoxyphenol hydroxylase-like FAD-dependent oxidoreductase
MQMIIVGGGIAGLSAALSLHQIGVDCRIYESVVVRERDEPHTNAERACSQAGRARKVTRAELWPILAGARRAEKPAATSFSTIAASL